MAFTLTLSGCGFHIRGHFQVPSNLTEITLKSQPQSVLAEKLEHALMAKNIQTFRQLQENTPVIELVEEKLDRRILSLLASGQVAEYELLYTVKVSITDARGEATEQQIQLSRDYQDDPNFALAKTREFELIIKEMQDDAVERILLLINQFFSERAHAN